MDGEVGVDSCMHDQAMGWNDEMPADDDQVMTDKKAGSPRDALESDGTDVGVFCVCPSGDVNGTETPAVDG